MAAGEMTVPLNLTAQKVPEFAVSKIEMSDKHDTCENLQSALDQSLNKCMYDSCQLTPAPGFASESDSGVRVRGMTAS